MENNEALVRQIVKQGSSRRLNNLQAFFTLLDKEQKMFYRNKEAWSLRFYSVIGFWIFTAIVYWNIGYDLRGI